MPTAEEIRIQLDDTFTGPVCDYSVGFLKIRREENQEVGIPAGTGTLVKLGTVYGILTAGHVVNELDPKSEVGLVRFPSVEPLIQNARVKMEHTERIVDWSGKNCDAPDIAFLRIPELDGRNLEAKGAVFYNLAHARDYKPEGAGHRMATCYAVVGTVGEWTDKGSSEKGGKLILGGLFGAATNVRPFAEAGTDLVEVDIDHASGPKVPKSYGGVSGGALWKLFVELDPEIKVVKVNKRLHGVAFRESTDRKRVTSNGSTCIDGIIAKIRAKWPDTTAV